MRQADLFSRAAANVPGLPATRAAAPAGPGAPVPLGTRFPPLAPVADLPPLSATHAAVRSPQPDHEDAARRLEETGLYRVLRRLEPRPVRAAARPAPGAETRLGIVVDTETTGLDHSRDEVIELGMVAFSYDGDGIRDVVDVFSALGEPSVPIAPEITRLTGITPEMVAGRRIDREAAARFVEGADLVIAHNAGFDRPFCEGLVGGFAAMPWACSVREIEWATLGFEGTKLGYLVNSCGWFHSGHRAADDCHALLKVLARPLPDHGGTAFGRLLEASRRTRVRLWAEGSPFHLKDALKARGYRWSDGSNGRPKAWWTEVGEDAHEAEVAYLRAEIYGRDVTPTSQRLTARDRFKR
ncbi:3'-5' exonuclease [Aureimonas leprariae]|uniref:3'-5' exonuclease n=2 Tax=Plantimonas leprariae TaxID=2615207 RepID=A0A7V7PNA7_9HYPH|nr:3'-5' exonuclease [Aureimonas leprariae]